MKIFDLKCWLAEELVVCWSSGAFGTHSEKKRHFYVNVKDGFKVFSALHLTGALLCLAEILNRGGAMMGLPW